jgi:hypothetical protein
MICLELVRGEGGKGGLTGRFACDTEEEKQKRADAEYKLPERAGRASLITTILVATASATRVY